MSNKALSYAEAGVDIDVADATKLEMKSSLETRNSRVLNQLGAFASLYDFDFPEISSPVLVTKMEEPGSKQLLAAQHGRLPDVGYDLVNHLINDTIMTGARPLVVQDTIVCGKLEKEIVVQLVDVMAEACRIQGCDLVGGETSEQPKVLPAGSYILSAACIGIVDRPKIVDGTRIRAGDQIFAVSSNGVHTNGYTLIRALLERDPDLATSQVGDKTFIDQVLTPHRCYNLPLQRALQETEIHGLAHITGGGVVDNIKRVVPPGFSAHLDLTRIKVLPVFQAIAQAGNVPHDDMLRTFNMGVGMVIIAPADEEKRLVSIFSAGERHGCSEVYPIGEMVDSGGSAAVDTITCSGELSGL